MAADGLDGLKVYGDLKGQEGVSVEVGRAWGATTAMMAVISAVLISVRDGVPGFLRPDTGVFL